MISLLDGRISRLQELKKAIQQEHPIRIEYSRNVAQRAVAAAGQHHRQSPCIVDVEHHVRSVFTILHLDREDGFGGRRAIGDVKADPNVVAA